MEIRRSMPAEWPWARDWWKPGTPRRMLEKAAAMIISEMERIDRAARKAEIERTQCKRGVGCDGLGECFARHHGASGECGRVDLTGGEA